MKPTFLNVDLEIRSSARLLEIEKELIELGASNLFSGEVEDQYLTTFEVNIENEEENTPDHIIMEFFKLTKQFTEKAKIEWNEAFERAFDIGYESLEDIEHPLEKETERALKGLRAITRFTTYKPIYREPDDTLNDEAAPRN